MSRADERTAEHPAAVVVYDGDCAFCTWSLDVISRTLPAMPASVDGRRADLAPLGLTADDAERAAWLVRVTDAGLERASGARAFSGMLIRQPKPRFRFAGHLMRLPGVRLAADAAYAVIAANRHRLPHGSATCRVDS